MASSANAAAAESLKQYKSGDCEDNPENKCLDCKVYKSGHLFLSYKGNGWTNWKKRWFILTQKSLVFYKSDPDSLSQTGNERILSLGHIIINNTGRIHLNADKRLFTVLFPDGCEKRAFALKAETSEDLRQWKAALENALAQAPSADLAMGPGGIFRTNTVEPQKQDVIYETPQEQNLYLLQSNEDYGTTRRCPRCQETGHAKEACLAVIVFGVRLDKPRQPEPPLPSWLRKSCGS